MALTTLPRANAMASDFIKNEQYLTVLYSIDLPYKKATAAILKNG
jgi:hypothetical protein